MTMKRIPKRKCRYRKCSKMFSPKRRGRPADYCSTRCYQRDWSEKHPRVSLKKLEGLKNGEGVSDAAQEGAEVPATALQRRG